MKKHCYQYSRGIYVHERPGRAVLTNEVELGLVSPARVGKYLKWVESRDVFRLRAADMILPSCRGRGVVKKLVRRLRSKDVIVRRSVSLGLMHQPRTESIGGAVANSLRRDPDSLVQFRLIRALARHGSADEASLLIRISKCPTPAAPPDIC